MNFEPVDSLSMNENDNSCVITFKDQEKTDQMGKFYVLDLLAMVRFFEFLFFLLTNYNILDVN